MHLAVPAAVVDARNHRWRTKTGSGRSRYLFSQKALAEVFRAQCLDALARAALPAPSHLPKKWGVDCTAVGSGEKALVYLGRYLYRGVIQEKEILTCQDGQVTFRYQDSKTRKPRTRTLSGAAFLWHLLRHVLPKGFRRTRNYGFLHPNRKRLIHLLQLLLKLRPGSIPARPRPALRCPCCGGTMKILHTRISPHEGYTRIQDVAAGYASFRTRVP